MISAKRLRERLAAQAELKWHPHWSDLVQIVTGPTSSTSASFPYICQSSFVTLIEEVPHLFSDGLRLLDWLRDLGRATERMDDLSSEEVDSLARASKVLQTVVFTAGITAPCDLWLLRQVFDAHGRLGLLDRWRRGATLSPERLAVEEGFNDRQMRIDCHLLRARGYLTLDETGFRASERPQTREVLAPWPALPKAHGPQLVERLAAFLRGEGREQDPSDWAAFFALELQPQPGPDWVATRGQIELSQRLVPLVLAIRVAGSSGRLVHGAAWSELPARVIPEMEAPLERAGLLRDRYVTLLGERVFGKGPGPFGIIQAYEPYMLNLAGMLRNEVAATHVNRARNVAASQDANRQTFEQANQALDAFCRDTGFRFGVFVEHAVGQGEAIRQRHARSGAALRYFGADLEDASIEAAIAQQRAGLLPSGVQWIRRADIGRPEVVIDFIRAQGVSTEGAVMMVGNGFHEIRNQTNERMIEVFRRYEAAGFVVIFTEESALSDADLLATAWNTYHAGFRYVHEMSGQGLRASTLDPYDPARLSWRACAERGGYLRLERYCSRTRTIFPFPREDGHNPSISVSHFCVPRRIAMQLGIASQGAG